MDNYNKPKVQTQQPQQQYIQSPSFSIQIPQQSQQQHKQHQFVTQSQTTSLPLHQLSNQKQQQKQPSSIVTPVKYATPIQHTQTTYSQPTGQNLQYIYDQPQQYKVTPEQQSQQQTPTIDIQQEPNYFQQQKQLKNISQQQLIVAQAELQQSSSKEKIDVERDLEKEKNQNQILSAINNQLQNHIMALESQLKSQNEKKNQRAQQQQNEEEEDDEELEEVEDNDIAEEDDDEDEALQIYKEQKLQKQHTQTYNEEKVKLLEQENQQLQKVCAQLREQASRYQSTNTNKIQNSIKNLELEKSYLESTIKLEKMNAADLQMKLNQVTEEKMQIAFQLEEKNNEFEQYKVDQQIKINDQYEKKILDLDGKANSLLDQNKKIMNINDQLLQEIDALKETNEITRINHQKQIDEIKVYWKQQMHEESNKLNQNLIQQSHQYEQSIAQTQLQVTEQQQVMLQEQQRHLKTKNELKNVQLRAEEFEQKLALSLKGNEQLMQVLEINQQEINKWKLKFNEQQEKYMEELEQMRTTANMSEPAQNLEEEKEKILKLLNDSNQEKAKLKSEIIRIQENNGESQQLFLESIKLNEEMKVKLQLQTDLESRYVNAQNSLQQNQRKLDSLQKNFEKILAENNKLNDQLQDRIKEVQIWQSKHYELEKNLDQNLKKFQEDFEQKCNKNWGVENDKFKKDFDNYQRVKEQQDQLIKDYHIEIQQLKTILTQRDQELNSLHEQFKNESLVPKFQQPSHQLTQHNYGTESYYYQKQYIQLPQQVGLSEDHVLLDQVNVFRDQEVNKLKRDNQELIHDIKVLKKRMDEMQFQNLKKEHIIVQVEQDKRLLKEQVTQLQQNLNRKALSMKEKDFTLQNNYELELIIKELRDQLFLLESEKLKLQEQLFQAELKSMGPHSVKEGKTQRLIEFLQQENQQLRIQLSQQAQQNRMIVNVSDPYQQEALQQENAFLKQQLSENSAIISEIQKLQNCVLLETDTPSNIQQQQQQSVLSPTQQSKLNINVLTTPPTQQQPFFKQIFTPVANYGNGNLKFQKENIQF